MKKSIILAILVAVVFLGLAFFEFVPMYISVTISICAFITYLSTSIIAGITALQETIKNEQKNTVESILKPIGSIINKLDVLVQKTENIKLQNDSLLVQVEESSKNVENVINEHSRQSNKILSEINSQTNLNIQRIEEVSNSLKASLSNATTEISKFNECVNQNSKETRDAINGFKTIVERSSDEFSKAIADTIHDMSTSIGTFMSKILELENIVNSYTNASNSLKESNEKTCSIISDLIGKLNDSTNNILRGNRQFVEELKELTSDNIEVLKNTLQNNITEQTDSLTENVEDLQTSIKNLSRTLSVNLEKLGVDVDAICASVDDMKQMSQNVETSDKELLAKILKLNK
ncbi:MAG: hypothetical protein MJZ41_06605 [Bacteroidaceae bacterium]|nr:hypothetical protein [Bacteroidaceae bacterium]